jgi:phosphatidylinositol glycan class B
MSIAVDSFYFGRWTWTAYNFLNFNILQDHSSTFGTSSFFTYFFPYMLIQTFTLYPFIFYGMYATVRFHMKDKSFSILLTMFGTYLLAHNIIPHKENRFIFPMYYITCTFIAIGIDDILAKAKDLTTVISRIITIVLKLLICIFIIISVIIWLHFTCYNHLAYKSDYFTSAFIGDKFASKSYCDLHKLHDPSTPRIEIYPVFSRFYGK